MSELFWRGRHVVVTGGGGFLGRHLCAGLIARGARLFVVRSADIDLRTPDGVAYTLAGASRDTVLFHLAATVGGIGANRARPADFYYDNCLMNTLLVDGAARFGVGKFVAVGSVCAYPKHAPAPFREASLFDGYPEETNAPYGETKRGLLVQLTAYHRQYGLPSAYVVPTNLYGPGDSFDLATSHVIPALIRKFHTAKRRGERSVTLWGTGRATRDFLYVRDCAAALILAAERVVTPEPINLGSGQETAIADLAEQIRAIMGYTGEIIWDDTQPDGQPRRVLDITRARERLGWAPRVSLDEGLRETVAWYIGLREGQRAS